MVCRPDRVRIGFSLLISSVWANVGGPVSGLAARFHGARSGWSSRFVGAVCAGQPGCRCTGRSTAGASRKLWHPEARLFENLYWCAFLLYLIGDPSDVPMMWRAKHVDFDTACGFDIQFLLGAGFRPTLAYLADHGHADIVAELSTYSELIDGLGDWEAFRRDYFYGSNV